MTTINFAEMLANADNVGEQVPDGAYDVQIVQAEPRDASTGKKMILVRCQVLTGPHASRVITNNFVLSPDNPTALGFFFRHMTVLGLDKNFFATVPQGEQGLTVVCQALVNRQARITVGTKDGRQNVTNWDTIPGGQLSATPTQQPAVFNAPVPSPVQGFAPAPQFGGQMPTAPQPQAPVQVGPAVPGQQPGYPQQPTQPQYAVPAYNGQPQYAQPQHAQPQQAQFTPQAPPGAPNQQATFAPTGEPYVQQAPSPQPAFDPNAAQNMAALQHEQQVPVQPPAVPAPQPADQSGVPQPPMPPF